MDCFADGVFRKSKAFHQEALVGLRFTFPISPISVLFTFCSSFSVQDKKQKVQQQYEKKRR